MPFFDPLHAKNPPFLQGENTQKNMQKPWKMQAEKGVPGGKTGYKVKICQKNRESAKIGVGCGISREQKPPTPHF